MLLAMHIWKSALIQTGEEEASYGRRLNSVISLLIPDMPRHWFVTAQKNQARLNTNLRMYRTSLLTEKQDPWWGLSSRVQCHRVA